MMVNTIYGEKDETQLEKKEGCFEDDNELTTWIEYYLNDELVHRSVHVTLKPAAASGEVAELN